MELEPKGHINATVAFPLMKQLDTVSKVTGRTKTDLIQSALMEYLPKAKAVK